MTAATAQGAKIKYWRLLGLPRRYPKDASTAENVVLQRITCKGNDAQLWLPNLLSVDGSGNFVYQLSDRGRGKCVEVKDESASFGAQVVQHTCDSSRLAGERWLLQGEILSTGVGFGQLKSALEPTMCLDTLGQLAKVFTCTVPNDAQLWRFCDAERRGVTSVHRGTGTARVSRPGGPRFASRGGGSAFHRGKE